MASARRVRVWDPLVRLFHWSLVIAFATAFVTGDENETVHAYAGYAVAALVVFRVIWGFVGTKHARFSNFIYGPGTGLAYLKGLLSRKPAHYLSHNPLGGWMVAALLLSLAATCWTGLEAYGAKGKGPLAGAMLNVVPQAHADEDAEADGGGDEFWEELHEGCADFTLLLVLLHLAGVIAGSILHRENLVRTMVTGWKDAPPE
jgi:cytochrome b